MRRTWRQAGEEVTAKSKPGPGAGIDSVHEAVVDLDGVGGLWQQLGKPDWERFGLTVTPKGQWVWLDSPDSGHTWPLNAYS